MTAGVNAFYRQVEYHINHTSIIKPLKGGHLDHPLTVLQL